MFSVEIDRGVGYRFSMRINISGAVSRVGVPALALACLGGCGLMKKIPEPEDVRVSEIRRSIHCGTEQRHAALSYFPTPEDWIGWQAERGLEIVPPEKLPSGPLLLLEMGERRTGGYFIEPKTDATIDRDRVMWLAGEWIKPGKDRMVTQMLTSPCVLLSIPPRDYRGFRIIDQNEELRSSLDLD